MVRLAVGFCVRHRYNPVVKFTNAQNLPQPLVDAVMNDGYSKGDADYSITGLLKPARASALERIHDDEITVDVADRIFSLVGQVVHGILERAERTAIPEKRLYATLNGKRISGQMDRLVLYGDGLLQDYKFVTLWKFMGGKLPEEYVAQVNGYNWLLAENGLHVSRLQILAIYRDWNKSKAFRDADNGYPQTGVGLFEVPLWELGATRAFFADRILAHDRSGGLPLCSDAERWKDPDVWAVYKPGGKRAVGIYDRKSTAEEHVRKFGAGYTIRLRRGEAKRCGLYCLAAAFCDQYQGEANDQQPVT